MGKGSHKSLPMKINTRLQLLLQNVYTIANECYIDNLLPNLSQSHNSSASIIISTISVSKRLAEHQISIFNGVLLIKPGPTKLDITQRTGPLTIIRCMILSKSIVYKDMNEVLREQQCGTHIF